MYNTSGHIVVLYWILKTTEGEGVEIVFTRKYKRMTCNRIYYCLAVNYPTLILWNTAAESWASPEKWQGGVRRGTFPPPRRILNLFSQALYVKSSKLIFLNNFASLSLEKCLGTSMCGISSRIVAQYNVILFCSIIAARVSRALQQSPCILIILYSRGLQRRG